MWKYILKRIGLASITLVIILSLTFILIKLLPVELPIGTKEQTNSYCAKQVYLGYFIDSPIERTDLGKRIFRYEEAQSGKPHNYYSVPVMKQYGNWVKNIVTEWNWGYSTAIQPRNLALPIIISKLPTSVKINVFAVIFSVPLGIALGIWAALKKNTITDHIISTAIMIFISIPSFVLITFLMFLLCYKSHWLPTQWPGKDAEFWFRVKGYVIPVLCLSFGSICGYARATRAELCEVMESDYLLLARTKGLTKKQSILRHALRNAMVPIVPAIISEFLGLLGGSMILESLYGIDGIGSLFITSINKKDYNVLFVDMALFTTIGLLAGVLLDLSYGFIDPRIRMGAKK